jgi:zinc transporter, ZIP family
MDDALLAAAWGAIAASSLLIGSFVAIRAQPSKRLVGLVLAFGTGTLISSVAYELVPDEAIDAVGVGIALALGGLVFYFGDAYVERMGGEKRKDLDATKESSGSGQSIVLGTVLDGIPESLVLGIGLAVGGAISLAFLAAVFISNLP